MKDCLERMDKQLKTILEEAKKLAQTTQHQATIVFHEHKLPLVLLEKPQHPIFHGD